MIPRSARRPTRRQSRNILGSMSLVLFTVLALILLCPVAVNADEDKKTEFGTVIGIGV
jgi:heat shock protein 5